MKYTAYSVPKIVLFSFVGWAWCGVIMAIGPAFFPMHITLILHAVLGPAGFGFLAAKYFKSHSKPAPIVLALIFLFFVIMLDAGLVAPVFVKSYAMFHSVLGTWLPFLLIFLVSLVTGQIVRNRRENE